MDYRRGLLSARSSMGCRRLRAEGIGVDRLVMLLYRTQPSIRDVILFPLMSRNE